jgi:hypothetical protein
MKLPRRAFLHLAAGATALPAVSRFAWAQTYPTRPVRLIVGVAAGGAMKPAIGYIRVSTARQGRSGLGLEAQQAALAKFCAAEAFKLVETYTETESGADDDRPQLSAAIERARKAKVPIIVAKLDRLSRDVHYISGLMKHPGALHRHRAGCRHRSLPATHLRRARRERTADDQPPHEGRAGGCSGSRCHPRRHA